MKLTIPILNNSFQIQIVVLPIIADGLIMIPKNGQYEPISLTLNYQETFDEAIARALRTYDIKRYSNVECKGVLESFDVKGTSTEETHTIVFAVDVLNPEGLDHDLELINIDTLDNVLGQNNKWSQFIQADTIVAIQEGDQPKQSITQDLSHQFDPENEFNVRVSARIIHSEQILVDTSYGAYGHVVPIGGRMQFNETLESSIEREVFEELSTPVLSKVLLGITEDHFILDTHLNTSKHVHFISYIYEVEVDTSKIIFADGCVGEWMDLEEFKSLPIKLESFKKYL